MDEEDMERKIRGFIKSTVTTTEPSNQFCDATKFCSGQGVCYYNSTDNNSGNNSIYIYISSYNSTYNSSSISNSTSNFDYNYSSDNSTYGSSTTSYNNNSTSTYSWSDNSTYISSYMKLDPYCECDPGYSGERCDIFATELPKIAHAKPSPCQAVFVALLTSCLVAAAITAFFFIRRYLRNRRGPRLPPGRGVPVAWNLYLHGTSAGPGATAGAGSGVSLGLGSRVSLGAGSGVSLGAGSGVSLGAGSGVSLGAGAGASLGTGTGAGASLGAGAGARVNLEVEARAGAPSGRETPVAPPPIPPRPPINLSLVSSEVQNISPRKTSKPTTDNNDSEFRLSPFNAALRPPSPRPSTSQTTGAHVHLQDLMPPKPATVMDDSQFLFSRL